MNTFKRTGSSILSCLLILSMLLSVLVVPSFAAASPTLSAENKTVNAGEQFTVSVSLANATAVCGGNFTLQYDSDLLTVDSYEYGSIVGGYTKNCNLNYQSAGNLIRFTFSGAYPLSADGTLVTFTFMAKEKVSGSAALQFNAYRMYDENGSSMTASANNSAITIKPIEAVSPSISITDKTVNVGVNFTLQYDSDLLTVDSYEYGSIAGGYTKNCNLDYQSAGNLIRFTFSGAYQLSSDGTLVTFTFKAKSTGTAKLNFTAYRMYDENGSSIATTASNGNVTVEENSSSNIVTGQCGYNAYYELNLDTGLMEITGTGGVSNNWEGNDKWEIARIKAKNIVIKNGVNLLSHAAFQNFEILESVIIPNGVTEIGTQAFSYCTSLVNITIPDSVTQIGEEAFNRCEALKNIVIPEGVKEIKHCTFYYCTSLERITIPSTVTAIDGGAFSFCKSLKSVIIPDGVIEIGSEAFYVCNSLESIIIPNSVTSFVGDMVFASCPNLTIYGYRNSTAKIYADEHSIPFIALDAVELSSISIATKPSKETYYVGDSLDTSGLQLTLTYSDGSTETVTSGFTTSGFSSTTAGTKTVTVTYEGKTTTFTVTVNTPAISLSSTNKTMKIGDTATLTVTTTPSGQSVTWTSSNTSVATVSNGTITAKAAGTATVTAKFTYNGHTYSQTCTVTVSAPEVTLISVSVAAMPTKTVYEIGDTLNTSGLKLKLTYSDGSTRTVTSGFTVSSPNMSTAGTKTVTVTYEGKTTTFTITVNSKEDPNPSGAKIIVDNKTAIVGNTVEVAVKLENNPGIASMTLKVDYDASVMKLVSVTDGGKLGTAVHSDNYKAPYTLCWVNDTATENFTANGTIVTLKFQILDDAVIGSYPITVSYDYDNYDIYNTDVEKVRFDTVSGGVTVTDILIGDVNSDGVVNNLDRLVLTRYLANWVDYPESTINMAAADVNMDGTVNNLDRLILTRHLANWNGYNELPYIK